MKIKKSENYRVVIEPYYLDIGTPEQIKKRVHATCNEIIDAVNRHIDNVSAVYMDCDSRDVCSHCGCDWCEETVGEPDCPKGTPLCCDAAIAEFDAKQAEEAAREAGR